MATQATAVTAGASLPSASASSKFPPTHHCAECSRVCRIRDRILHAVDAHLNDHVKKKPAQQQQPPQAEPCAVAAAPAATTATVAAVVAPVPAVAPVNVAPTTAKVTEPVVAADATAEIDTNADTPPPVPVDAPTDTAADEASIVAPVPAAVEIPPAVVVAPSTFLTLPALVELLRPLADVRALLCAACPPDFMGVLASEIKEAVFAYLLSVREDDDAMRAWSRRTIARPLIQVEMLLTAAKVDAVEIKRIFEMFELDWAWAYARSRTLPLDRRISAINDIKDVIDFVEKKEEWFRKKGSQSSTAGSMLGYVNAAVASSLSSQPDQPPAYTRIWMNSDALCKFILQNNLLEELLEPSTTHVELIRRCQPLMRLLSMQSTATTPAGKAGSSSSSSSSASSSSLLTTAHLDLLWQLSCMGKHESIEHLVYDIVARLSTSLSLPLLNHLWARICERPFAAYDTIYLTLIHSFTLNTLKADSPVAQAVASSKGVDREQQQTYGIDLLWTLLQSAQISARGGADSSSSSPVSPPKTPSPAPSAASASSSVVSPEVLLRARDLLLDLLSLEACVGHRSRFMDRCVLNLKNGVLVAQSLHILLKLIQMYPLKSSSWFGGSSSQTQPAVIEALDEKYDLLNLVLQEMAAFQTRINQAEQAKGAQSGSPAHAAAAAALSAKQQLEQLEVREEFLVSILTHSALTLSKAQVDLVWNSLVVQASQSAARDSVYAWLIDACDQDAAMMTDDVRAHLFNTKLLTLHPASLTPLGFKLFLRYFLRVHVKAGVMKMSDVESNVANTPSSSGGKALKGEFGRILAKHRGRPLAGAVASKSVVSSSNALQSKGPPMLERSLSELGAESVEYSVLSDEEQLAASPQFEANVLSNTQRMCSSLSVHQYSELRGIPLLWDIILRNPRARVARQAIVLLNTLHQNLSSKVKNVAAPIGAGNPPTAASNSSAAAGDSASQIRDAHLKACLSHLSKALAETSTPSNGHSRAGSAKDMVDVSASDAQSKKKISRCIFVLKTFLNGFADKSARKKATADDTAAQDTFVLHIHPNREYRTEPFDVSVSRHDTIGDLRTAVFSKLSASNPTVSLKTMCLVWENKKLLTNHFGLGNVGFKTHDHVIIKRNSDLFTAYTPHAMVYSSPAATVFSSMLFDCLEEPWVEMQGREKYMCAPSIMARTIVNEDADRSWARKKTAPAATAGAQGEDASLSSIATDPASFDRLFALLSSNSPIAPSVFEILMMLPSSPRGLAGLLDPRSFNPERWESLLDPKAMYRLLYSLQSIEEILSFRTPAFVRASPAMQALDLKSFDLLVWAQGFISKGGVHYLAALATNKAWQQSHNGGGPPPSSTLATTGSKRLGSAASSATASVTVPRAIYQEVLQSLFSILYTFFCFDVSFPGGQQRATRGQAHLAEGCWTRLPNWESWLKLLVNEAIIPAMLNSQINLSAPISLTGEAGARDDNSTSMILSAMRLLVGCMFAVPSLLPSVFYDQETLTPRLLTVLLLECPSSAARTQAAQGFLSIFKLSLRHASNPEQKAFWLRILVQLLRSPALNMHAQQSQEFFLLFSSYIDVLFSPVHAATQAASRSLIQSLSLFPTLWTLLQEHVSTELYENYLQVDERLFGLLQLLRCLVTNHLTEEAQPAADLSSMAPAASASVASSPSLTTLLSYVYHECLFNTPADDALQGCKCKTHSTRIQAFALLLELSAAHEPCYAELLDMLCADGMWQIVRPDTQWTYDPTHFEKGLVPAPVGLKNQGATCYMNSFVQVLFSTKVFRNAIMALRTDIDDDAAVAHSNDAVARASSRSEDSASIVHQLQLLFGHLAWSQKSFFDTLSFCSNFRDYSGLPINIGEQKDVNEFAALLFDQLENEVNQLTKPKGSSNKGGAKAGEEQKASDAVSAVPVPLNPTIQRNVLSQRIIDRTFKGALVHQILALNPDECPHTTAREEAFSMLSLTVVNKRNVDQSLQGFIEGDRLDGENKFMCQGCSKKVAALKRCCLHDTKLPQVLILHFKRFNFDYDSMRKEKVNDLFEFPYKQGDVLNVQKFTQEGIARAEAIAKGLEPPPATPRPEGFYEYSLVAVLIHGGSAEGGHYITICKGEVPSAANAAATSAAPANGSEGVPAADSSSDQSSFFEFNDSVVRPFNPADIPAACFGGTELVEQFDKTLGRTVMKEVPQVKNAYMAIFERKWKPNEEEAEKEAAAASDVAAPAASASAEKKPDDAASSLEDKPQTPQESEDATATSTDDILLETDEKADGESKPLPASVSSSALPTHVAAPSASSSSASSSSAVVPAAPSGAIYSFDRSRPDLSHFPRAVIDTVWSDNLAFLHDKFVMDANTNWFLWTLVQLHLPGKNAMMPLSATMPPAPDTSAWASKASVPLAKLSVLFVLKLLVRNADNASFPQWVDLLYQIFDWDAAARDWFMDFLVQGSNMEAPAEKAAENAASSYLSPNAGSALLVQLLFESPVQIVREAMCDLVVFVISAAREDKQERALYFADWKTPAAAAPAAAAAASHDGAASSSAAAEAKAVAAAEPSKEPTAVAADAAVAVAEPAPLAVPVESSAVAATAVSAMEPRASTPSPSPAAAPLPRLPSSRIIRVFQYLLDWVPRVRKYHRSYKEYWRLLFLLARLGVEERKWFVGAGTIQLILRDFYLDLEPLTGFNQTHPYGTDPPRRKHVPMPFWMLQLLSLLVRSCETDVLKGIGPPAPSQTARTLIPLSSTERELLLAGWVHHPPATHPPTRHLLPWLLLDRGNPSAVVGLVVHWCWERVDYSSRMFDLLLRLTVSEITTMADAGEYKLLFAVYTAVLCIADSHPSQTARVEYGLSELMGLLRKVVVRNKIGDQKLLFHAMPMLLQSSFKSPVVALWMDTHQRDHAGWLADYKRTRVEIAQQMPQQNYRRA